MNILPQVSVDSNRNRIPLNTQQLPQVLWGGNGRSVYLDFMGRAA